jgi:hypothetical protein
VENLIKDVRVMGIGVLIIIIAIAVGYGFGRYVQPAKVVTVVKEVKTDNQVVDKNIVTTVTETKKPDGSDTIVTKTEDKSVDKTKENDTFNSTTTTTNQKTQWRVSALAGLRYDNLTTPNYGAIVEKRLLGPIFVGAWGNSGKEAGISIGLEF